MANDTRTKGIKSAIIPAIPYPIELPASHTTMTQVSTEAHSCPYQQRQASGKDSGEYGHCNRTVLDQLNYEEPPAISLGEHIIAIERHKDH
ncbi:MAG: hypothetical protein K2J49_07615, partial [Muribaculaceae bacterium]|nr:hypothetical protein [Muribaculaceae bacterium]